MTKPKDTIAAVQIYVAGEFDSIDEVLEKIPEPWKEYHYDTRRLASSNNREFRDCWEVKCWAEVKDGQTRESLEHMLLDALDGEWIVEDISRLETERNIIDKMRRGLSKGKHS